ncbi:cysteine desulfurase family protein [Pseudolabrys sp. FHR47]|uniref:cysteine desulfurase family protein n=1 Tax=Pseudolabrys sp. FHR47 TaxID=2562284 RepID=UPI0010BF058B|nr:aminotransferase class V-fold PLP-dependent enzyme [Pseudolabrys sp. FHR47]
MAVYLDSNATTPIEPAVLEAMLPYLREHFGNPSSAHALGHAAHAAVDKAHAQVASLIGAAPDEIVFTSGGTEASNMAIRGAAAMSARRTIVTTNIEHPATDSCCAVLAKQGFTVKRLKSSAAGLVDAAEARALIDSDTALVTIIHAQNEIGTLQPVAEIAAIAHAAGALVHVDVAQSVGKVPVDVTALGADLLSIAGHKLYAPKGVGVLYIRRSVALPPLLVGAGQENGRRPGTENVPYMVALGEACRLAQEALPEVEPRLRALSARLLERLIYNVTGLALVGDRERRLPNTLNVLFPGVSGRQLLANCPGVLASNGSACHSDSEEPSAILLALGIPREAALGTVRLSLGRHTTESDVDAAAERLAEAWHALTEQNLRRKAG